MMHRNLDRRVEVLATVTDPRLKSQVHRIFDSALDPLTRSFHLNADATWSRMPTDEHWADSVDHQEQMAATRTGFLSRWAGRRGTPDRAPRGPASAWCPRQGRCSTAWTAPAHASRWCTAPGMTTGPCPRARSIPENRYR